jgi:hypothetical protein
MSGGNAVVDIETIEQVLTEAFEDIDNDDETVYNIVKEIRKRIERPKFAPDVSDPNEEEEDTDDSELDDADPLEELDQS